MKKLIVALTVAVFVLFLTNSLFSVWNVPKATFTNAGIPPPNIGQASSAEGFQNSESRGENAVSSVTETSEAKTCESAFQSEHSQQSLLETDQTADVNASPPETRPPDGAIYYGGEPPYAYIPTYDPREPYVIRIPNVPPEPES
jgi:hypothetical protein